MPIPHYTGGFRLLLACAALLLVTKSALAGPPFVTDDPEPVDYRHWEVYFSSIYQHFTGGSSGTLPHIEVNNGVAPNLQLHIIAPAAFSTSSGTSASMPVDGPLFYGLGDIELGAKFRFVPEKKQTPMVG